MAMTIVEKILARAGGVPNVSPGDFVVVNVDTAVLFDNNFSTLYWRDVLKVADPEKIVVAFDHRVPPPDKASAQAQVVGRDFVDRFGIKRFHDIWPQPRHFARRCRRQWLRPAGHGAGLLGHPHRLRRRV